MGLDAVIISDSAEDSVSSTNPLRARIDGKIADIQVVQNYLAHHGHIALPIVGNGTMSWASAPKLNGIFLYNYLTTNDYDVALINKYYEEREVFYGLLLQTPRCVIISTTFIHNKQALHKLVEDIRSLAPDVFVIVGGPFIYLSYLMLQRSVEANFETEAAKDDFLFLRNYNEPSVDLYIVSLRGEQILLEALKRIKQGKPLGDLPNSAYLVDEAYYFSNRIDDVSNTEEILVDWLSLPDFIFKSGVVPLQASNGCPYKCAFCNFTKDPRLLYVKPVHHLIEEMKAVSFRGAQYVWFVDDNFRLGSEDLNSVCLQIVEEGLELSWMSFIRASTLKSVDFELLKQAGCREVQLGLESADAQVLHNMNKKANSELYAEVVQNLLAVGINCTCYFIFGFPGETDETVLRTREFIKSIEHPELDGILSWSMFPFLLGPLSPVYEYEVRKKYSLTGYMQDWQHETMASEQARERVIETFLELENSGAIYRGDNQEMLRSLTPKRRQEFVATRHRFSKMAMKCQVEMQDIITMFGQVFPDLIK